MAETVDKIVEEMYQMLVEAAGKTNVSANDLTKAVQAKLGQAACSRDDCKKAIRVLTESGRAVYCFLGGVTYIQVPKQEAASTN